MKHQFDADLDAVFDAMKRRNMNYVRALAVLGACVSAWIEEIADDAERYRLVVGFIRALTNTATGLENE
jgi:hypothetical protein